MGWFRPITPADNRMHVFQLDSFWPFIISGADRLKWLQNLCTQDLRTLDEGKTTELFLTDVKGRAIAHGVVAAFNQRLLLIVQTESSEKLLQHLDRYIIRENVQVLDGKGLSKVFGLIDSESEDTSVELSIPTMGTNSLVGESTVDAKSDSAILGWPIYGERSGIACIANEHLATWESMLTSQSLKKSPQSEFEWLRIAAGWPNYGVDYSSENLAQEVNRTTTAISFHKGCYLGQETVARLDMIGQLQKKLCRIMIEGEMKVDSECELMKADQKAGWITSSAIQRSDPTSSSRTHALAMIKRAYFQPNTVLEVMGHPATVQ